MRNKLFILFIFFTTNLFSQKGKIAGTLVNKEANPISFATVFIKNLDKVVYCNSQGFFSTPKLDYGQYIIEFQSFGFDKSIDTVNLQQSLLKIDGKILIEKNYNLNEFEIVEENEFDIRKLRAIEGVMITQGKKSEAINVDKMNANKATNLSRQIFAKIPGLNIWESDGAGIQIGLGGRGLNPSRNSNFNTRQNGYDISADALGYPESYYTPPSEAVEEIQLIRGAASLQFGPQFGGLINFKLKEANPNKKLELVARHTIGSYGLNNSFLSLGGKKSKWLYYGYLNYKFGNDFRPNSEFDVVHGHLNIKNQINEKTSLGIEFTKMYYLAHQPGGLTDDDFFKRPDTSSRARNWFQVDWNLANINFDYEINSNTKINSRLFALSAYRNSLGDLSEINRVDPDEKRNLISGDFRNIGNETRLVHLYEPFVNPWAFVIGVRAYKGFNKTQQGDANSNNGPDFYFDDLSENIDFSETIQSDYDFPSFNFSAFIEHIFNLSNKLSITPGFRYEYISTSAIGKFRRAESNLVGTPLYDTILSFANQNENRDFIIGGVGVNYKISNTIELYSNFSQNYRSINFSDMQISNPNFIIDPKLKDERGYNCDIGIRGKIKNKLYFDASVYTLFYNNRIGTRLTTDTVWFKPIQFRTNISQSRTIGFEMMVEADWFKLLSVSNNENKLSTFINFSFNDANYINSDISAFQNKKVELVPPIVLKTGLSFVKGKYSISYQYSYTHQHFSDATNSENQVTNAVVGLIYSYFTMDLSCKIKLKRFQLETGINNLSNEIYFTRRATGYPGPGIIPSTPRNIYLGLQIKI
jgi:Fe(3+) dicitrate transport protein